jgi:hypothetical protein
VQIEGDAYSICEDAAGNPLARCYQLKHVPVNQGLFVFDTLSRKLRLVARTGGDEGYADFLYWNYSGAPPGAGESEGCGEPPRFRSAAFLSVSARAGATFRLAFLARTGDADAAGVYRDPVDGIYLAEALGASGISTAVLLRTGWDGTILDPRAIDPASGEALPISSLALEREGFRRGWLAVAAGMGTEDAGWAGIYLADLRDERPLP